MTKVGKPYTMVYPNLELWSRLTRVQPRSYHELSAQVAVDTGYLVVFQNFGQAWKVNNMWYKVEPRMGLITLVNLVNILLWKHKGLCWKHEHPQNPQIWTLLLTNPKLPGHLLAWRLVVPVAVLVKSQNGNNEKNKRTNHVDFPRLVMKCVRGWDQ